MPGGSLLMILIVGLMFVLGKILNFFIVPVNLFCVLFYMVFFWEPS